MRPSLLRNGVLAGFAMGSLAGVLLASPISSRAATLSFTINPVGAYGGEPSITSDAGGTLYEASLLAAAAFRSTNGGVSWTRGTTNAFGSTGDDCLSTDQGLSVYLCNLTITGVGATSVLQADAYKSVDQGNHWTHGAGLGGNTTCGTSCSPFGVDRDWIDATIPPGGTTSNAEVVLMYHDFYGPSHIWVNVSQDGGATFATASDVLANLSPSAGAGDALALADTACSTVPAGVKIAKGGPHPGRVFVAWIAADPSSFGTGCNLSQAQAFHNLFIAYTDPPASGRIGAAPTWTPQLAFDAGATHDSSTPFVGFDIDDQGNPYYGFANNLNWDPTCGAPLNPQTPNCEYDMYLVWSPDQGTTWRGSGTSSGLIPGSAGSPSKVNADVGTHWFPAIAAAGKGLVDVAYLETSDIIPTDPSGKQHPGGCLAPGCTSTDQWFLWGAQASLVDSGGNPDPSPVWSRTQITPSPMHIGDICNLGIACPPTANRNLADFISETVDPTGCAHIAYADDNIANVVESANQTAGCFSLNVTVPELAWPALFVPAGALAAVIIVVRRRRTVGTLA